MQPWHGDLLPSLFQDFFTVFAYTTPDVHQGKTYTKQLDYELKISIQNSNVSVEGLSADSASLCLSLDEHCRVSWSI